MGITTNSKREGMAMRISTKNVQQNRDKKWYTKAQNGHTRSGGHEYK